MRWQWGTIKMSAHQSKPHIKYCDNSGISVISNCMIGALISCSKVMAASEMESYSDIKPKKSEWRSEINERRLYFTRHTVHASVIESTLTRRQLGHLCSDFHVRCMNHGLDSIGIDDDLSLIFVFFFFRGIIVSIHSKCIHEQISSKGKHPTRVNGHLTGFRCHKNFGYRKMDNLLGSVPIEPPCRRRRGLCARIFLAKCPSATHNSPGDAHSYNRAHIVWCIENDCASCERCTHTFTSLPCAALDTGWNKFVMAHSAELSQACTNRVFLRQQQKNKMRDMERSCARIRSKKKCYAVCHAAFCSKLFCRTNVYSAC